MVHNLIYLMLVLLILVMPVTAAMDAKGVETDGSVSVTAAPPSPFTPRSLVDQKVSLASVASEEDETGASFYAADGALAGGYYFVCDCALGSDLTFYVPQEFAYDVFTSDGTGTLVNLSNTTCYAYCPDYADYTFSCSRFGTFTYRTDSYNTNDLNVKNISDSNMTFLENDPVSISESDMQFVIAALIFIVAAILIIRR